MASELSNTKFKNRLTELTSPEQPIFLLTPYKFNGKPFCGTFTNDSFRLTRNSPWHHIKLVSIKGTYLPSSPDKTKVEYRIGRRNWKRNFLIALLSILIAVNTIITTLATNADSSTYLVANIFVLIAIAWGFLLTAFSRFVVNQRFKSEFSIDIKPTDLNGYAG